MICIFSKFKTNNSKASNIDFSFTKYLLSIYYVSGSVLGTGDLEVKNIDKNAYPQRAYFLVRGQVIGEYIR